MKHTLSIIFICFFSLQNTFAQQDLFIGQLVELQTEDGNSYVGKVLSLTDSNISIETDALGEISLSRASIKKVIYKNENAELDKNGFPIDYHNSTHYFINQSGYSLKKGQSYYENVGVFFNSYSVGITDNFSLTAGLEIATLLFGQSAPSLFVTPKFTIPFGEGAGGFSIGSTIFAVFVDDPLSVGVVQASATFGTRNNNFTIGSGLGFSFSDGIAESVVPFNLSGMFRISKKLSFMSDNFIIAYDDFNGVEGILSAGLRIHFAKNGNALNLGLFRPTGIGDDFLALPFISATIAIK